MLKYGKFDIVLDNTELEDYQIPKEYDGAAVKLIFSKKASYIFEVE